MASPLGTRPAVYLVALEIISKSLCMLGKTSATELHRQLKGEVFRCSRLGLKKIIIMGPVLSSC